MNKWILVLASFLTFFQVLRGQIEDWSITILNPMPIATAYNTICEATVGAQKFVYSFSGVKDELEIDSCHNRIFKYDVTANSWSEINAEIDTTQTLERRAVFINNRIYLMGGYYFDENNEMVVDGRNAVFNPFLDTLESFGSPLPTPVRGQVSVKWRDSLIYVIGGLNSAGEYSTAVQIYDPFFNTWVQGEPLPNNDFFKHSGAAGHILGDTIYYFGGMTGSFVPETQGYLRKGVIDPNDPTSINWQFNEEIQLAKSYNAACSGFGDKLFLFGGSRLAYDFDLTDTISGQLVFPRGELLNYLVIPKTNEAQFPEKTQNAVFGIAQMGGGNWITAGGVDSLGVISNRAFLLNNKDFSAISQAINPPFFQVNETLDSYIVVTENIGRIRIYDLAGNLLYNTSKGLSNLVVPKSDLPRNYLLFVYYDGANLPVVIRKVLVK